MDSQLVQPASVQASSSEPPRSWRKHWWLVFWVALPIVLWWSFRNVPARDIWATFQNLNSGSILFLVALNAILLLSFSSRWWLILRAQGYRLSYWKLAGYRLAGFGITYFTPGPQLGGEPLQIHLLTHKEQVPVATAAASVTLDKLLELLANFTFLLVGVTTILASGALGEDSNYLFLLLPVGLLILPAGYLLSLWRGKRPAAHLAGKLAGRFPASRRLEKGIIAMQAAEEEAGQFFQGHPGTILIALSISFMIWVLLVLEFGLALRFLGLHIGLPEVITALTAARLAFLLPIPAGIGTLETGQILAMGLIGASPAIGISISLLIRVRDAALGGLGLWWGGMLTRYQDRS